MDVLAIFYESFVRRNTVPFKEEMKHYFDAMYQYSLSAS
jgi:hypothetical protein